jgi:tetratricopeptide (TPR) repeat protein
VLGSTRPEGDALQVNVQLIEAESGRQLWAAPFHYAPGAVNRPVARIARSIGVKVIMVESQLPLPAKPEAGHYTILARSKVITEFDPAANKEALALYEKALDADPRCLPALLGLARAHVADLNNGWAPRRERPLRLDKAEDAVRRAIEIAPGNFAALQLRGQLLRARGNSEEAIAAFAYVLDLNSNFAAAHAELGRAKIDVGRPREAVEHIKKAIAISPSDPLLYLWYMWLGLAELDAGNNEAALQWLLKARQANRAYTTPLPWVAVAYLLLEREEEARARMAEYAQDIRKRGVPGLTIRAWREKRPPRDDAVGSQRRRIEDALRRLGVPEGGGAIETGSAR